MSESSVSWRDGDIEGVLIRTLKAHSDSRGWLMELFRSDELDPALMPEMCYVSQTRPGQARGPHAHREQTDCFAFVISGCFELRMWDNRKDSATFGNKVVARLGADNPALVVIPPGVVHGYRNISQEDGLVLNLPNRLYAGRHRKEPVDEVRYEDMESSAFTMGD